MKELSEISILGRYLNSNYKGTAYALEVKVIQVSTKETVGVLKKPVLNKTSEYVFQPSGPEYIPYQPDSKGE